MYVKLAVGCRGLYRQAHKGGVLQFVVEGGGNVFRVFHTLHRVSVLRGIGIVVPVEHEGRGCLKLHVAIEGEILL